jgi:hypothetical protein
VSCGVVLARDSRADAEIGLVGETGRSYVPLPVGPFLEQAAKLDQGRSHVVSRTHAVRDKSI